MNILTFDIEDWFHLLDNESTKTVRQWSKYDSRIQLNMDRIFSILEKHNQKATCFCLGWVAEKYPEIIREIDRRGFEIGSHTMMHQLAYNQTEQEFRNDVEYSIKTIEDIIGKKVRCFRAPGFSITENNIWAFEVLVDLGIEIDSSIFPTGRAHGGFPSYGESMPSIVRHNGVELKELPINTYRILGKDIIFSGGGYFRLAPYQLIQFLTKRSPYVMSYLHPRDFDFEQPLIEELSLFRRFKSYVGLKGTEKKLSKWLDSFDFVDINEANNKIDWQIVNKIEI